MVRTADPTKDVRQALIAPASFIFELKGASNADALVRNRLGAHIEHGAVLARSAVEDVARAILRQEAVIAVVAEHLVGAFAAFEHIIARTTPQAVIAVAAAEVVGERAARDLVVAFAADDR